MCSEPSIEVRTSIIDDSYSQLQNNLATGTGYNIILYSALLIMIDSVPLESGSYNSSFF